MLNLQLNSQTFVGNKIIKKNFLGLKSLIQFLYHNNYQQISLQKSIQTLHIRPTKEKKFLLPLNFKHPKMS